MKKNNRRILAVCFGSVTHYALSRDEDDIQPGDVVKLPTSTSPGVVTDIAMDYSGECLRMLSRSHSISMNVEIVERKFTDVAAPSLL